MLFLSRAQIEQAVAWNGDDQGELEVDVPILGIALTLTITLEASDRHISNESITSILDLQRLADDDRDAIAQFLHDDAARVRDEVDFSRAVAATRAKPPGLFGRLFVGKTEASVEVIPKDDPAHPCYLPRGKDGVLEKITWTGLRIEEYLETRHRYAFIDCRPAWEREHDRSVVIRDGRPCGIAEFGVDVSAFDEAE